MNDDSIEKSVQEKSLGFVKKFNLFNIWPATWMLLMYYLGVNSMLELVLNNINGLSDLIPLNAIQYNNLIMSYLNEYAFFAFLIASGLFICGVLYAIIRNIPIISDYNIIMRYAHYGLTSGLWLFGICMTYAIYHEYGILVLIAPALIYFLIWIVKKGDKNLKRKIGFSFLEGFE